MTKTSDETPDYLLENAHLGCMGTFLIKRELRHLQEILLPEEELLTMARGKVDHLTWLMAVTDRRVLLMRKGVLFGHRQLEVPVHKIKSVSYKTGLFKGAIFVDTEAGTVVLESVVKKGVPEVCSVICEALAAADGRAPSVSARGSGRASGGSLVAQLERLSDLRDKGVLTDREFLAQKRRLVADGEDQGPATLSDTKPRPAASQEPPANFAKTPGPAAPPKTPGPASPRPKPAASTGPDPQQRRPGPGSASAPSPNSEKRVPGRGK